jgi:hypothetical protein
LGRSLLEGGGGLLGSAFGAGELGKTAGRHLSHLFGLGDYSVKSNIFLQGRLPEVTNIPSGGGTIVRFQEYLGDIVTAPTANTFQVDDYTINAANLRTFPWLSQIANNYEQYSFEGLVFEFRSTSADALNSVNTALGTVMMATQYDVSDDNFSSKAEMLNYEFSNSVKPSDSCLHMIECAPRQTTLTELYTLSGLAPAGYDPRFYNLGRFQIATSGFQGTSVTVGELHVTYQVRLLKPKLSDALGDTNGYAVYDCVSVSGTNAFGSSRVQIEDNLGITFPTNNSLMLPASSVGSSYLLIYTSTAVSAGSSAITVPSPSVANGTVNWFRQNPAVGITTQMFHHISLIETDPGVDCVVTFSITYGSTIPGYIRVVEVPKGSIA